jgi:DNA-binding transcriptional regulator LsrR (DeoR family)
VEDARLPLNDGPPSADLVADADRALMLRAAWHYFIEERTQAEIADMLGVTRFRVNRMLAECRAEGHVRVEITAPLASCVATERQLVEAFGLRDAIVVPSPDDPERTHAMIGAGLARYMSGRIADPDTRIFGIGWGRTMREMLRFLRPVERPESKVVTLLGALPNSSEENAIEIIGKLGRMLNAERYYMTAPIYANTPEAREVLATQPFYTAVRDLILESDVACFAASEMSDESLLIRLGLPRGISVEELRAAGAVGDVLGTFLDIEGKPVDHPINDQLVGPGPEELRSMKTLVLASGGSRKTDIITGALRSGLIHVLVCDEATARKVLSRGPLRKR